MNRTASLFTMALLAIGLLTGATCKVSLSGQQVPPDVRSITVQYFPNQSALVAPALSQTFTEALKDKFLQESNLDVVPQGGDWELSGAIVRYESTPIAPTGTETTALNRLTITIKVDFISRKNEAENWTQNFMRFEDYESSLTLNQAEADLIPRLSTQIADDILQKLTQNW